MKEAMAEFYDWRKIQVKAATSYGYNLDLRHFCLYARNPVVSDIEIGNIVEWLNDMAQLGWDMNSLERKSIALRKFFEYLRRNGAGVIDEELIPIPEHVFKMPRIADLADYHKLIASIPAASNDMRHVRNAALIRMYFDTGARNSEILALDVVDLDLVNYRAVIKTAKSRGNRPFREIYWTKDTNEHLVRWLRSRQRLSKKRVFESPSAAFVGCAGALIGRRLTKKGVGELMRRQCHRAGIPDMNVHSLRHYKARDINEQGGSGSDIMNLLGHATIQSSQIYQMLRNKPLEDRARKFMNKDPWLTDGPLLDNVSAYGTQNKEGRQHARAAA